MGALQIDAASVEINEHVCARGLGDGRRVPVREQARRVTALADIVEDVELDCDAAADPASRAGAVRAIAEAAARGSQRGRSDALDGEGEAVGHGVRAGADLEGEGVSEGGDAHALADEGAAGLPGTTIGQAGT